MCVQKLKVSETFSPQMDKKWFYQRKGLGQKYLMQNSILKTFLYGWETLYFWIYLKNSFS